MPEITLPEMLRRAAQQFPSLGITYVLDDGKTHFQSYSELYQKAQSMASGLRSLGLEAGNKAIIATDINRETITCLWGCFLCGIIPTILQTPLSMADQSQAAIKLMNVFQQLEQPIVITSKPIKGADEEFNSHVHLYSSLPLLEVSADYLPNPGDLAFIQFSSGSTGDPKGIQLTQRNLMVNMNSIANGLRLVHSDATCNWMPLYHDMGLIGYHLTPIYFTHNQFHIETIDFIKNPSLWLDTMSQNKVSVTGCPNFGQALVLRHLKRKTQLPDWNFSSMKAMLNGAEPISVKIMEEFTSSLQKFNFPEDAMMPVYGMAEATLAISFTPLMQPSIITGFDSEVLDLNQKAVKIKNPSSLKSVRNISAVGVALDQVSIRIVDDNEQEVQEGNAGHIQILGESITQGYFKNPEATEAAFSDKWLRTGDIGFFFEGNLYISGRYKDIIFLNGKNYFAHDLENLACTLEDISYGKLAFGGITDPKTGKEKVLLFLAGIPETKAAEMLHTLRTLLRKNLGIQLDELVLIRSNEIPKTSSGKIQRYRLIQRYQQGEFKDNRHK
ncbi:MAG: AMP-binding protein [Bacteroidales bacterium]|nr:AMP-binding protein [Bacteroidales bacterium]